MIDFLQSLLTRRRLLSDVERGVDQADNKLNDAMSKMRKFIRETEGQYELQITEQKC